jgi:hypothetical protein
MQHVVERILQAIKRILQAIKDLRIHTVQEPPSDVQICQEVLSRPK